MKYMNKILLEAINRGIKLALDDFDDIQDQKIILSKKKIQNYNNANDYLSFLVDSLLNIEIGYNEHDPDKFSEIKKLCSEIYQFINENPNIKYIVKDKRLIAQITLRFDKVIKLIVNNSIIDLNWLDVSQLDNLSGAFHFGPPIGTYFNVNISEWDVSNVTTMRGMFDNCHGFNCDLSKWNVSKVRDMSGMFASCHSFNNGGNTEGLNNWDVSNVECMDKMFWLCSNFNCNISEWNVSKVYGMNEMFTSCRLFNQNISKWNTKSLFRAEFMFDSCTKFNCDISNWDVHNLHNALKMFKNCKNFNQDLNSWEYAPISFQLQRGMFAGCKSLKNKPKWYKW